MPDGSEQRRAVTADPPAAALPGIPAAAGAGRPAPTVAEGHRATAIRLEAVRKTFGDVVAVESVDLEVLDGAFFSLLGSRG